jgi:murein tripeptide amidase MpaA
MTSLASIIVSYSSHLRFGVCGQDAQVTKFLEEIEWSIFPVINADGYSYSWSTDRMWRKNRYVR